VTNRWSTINRTHGLFDNGAFQILEDARRNFWFSSNRGIYRVPRQQLVDVASGRAARVDSVSYGPSDGMLSAECNGGTWPPSTSA
jgi:ligand-binding sensor domain-containing protein